MKLTVTLPVGVDERELIGRAVRESGLNREKIATFTIYKKALDARDKGRIKWVYNVGINEPNEVLPPLPEAKKHGRVLVVGSGPAGLFAALYLARGGLEVTLAERGKSVEERARSVENYIATRTLDPESNVQFGEGGAGAFSDGKLNTQVNNSLIKRVLGDFAAFGAPEEVTYVSRPHIGSDRLPAVVAAIREEIKRLGGRVIFGEKLNDIKLSDGRASTSCAGGEFDEIVLAIGHSARDTFAMLQSAGVAMESKNFAVGCRIEHPQEAIDRAQYGKNGLPLPPAEYKLVSHAGERSVFTFCMCPGGVVIPASSEEGALAVNGMSNFKRDGRNANSAVVAEVRREDFGFEGPLAGVEFQRVLERRAFEAGGRNWTAPACKVGDFLRKSGFKTLGTTIPTYPLGVVPADLTKVLPAFISDAMALGIRDMGRRLRGFDSDDGILTAVESRTSSPVRIPRGENLASASASNLYPCGEGAGYAGGITSAAADGIRVAAAIIEKYR